LRLALVGTGKITQQAHLPAVLRTAGVEVTALVDTSEERARALADRNGLDADVSSRLEDVLDKVDGAIIATPNHTHRALTVACCQAGVHALVEKPLATSLADCEAIEAAATEAGVTVAVGYCTRYLDTVVLMKKLLDERYFGRPQGFAYQFGTRGGWAPDSGYTLDRGATGGGVLMVSGTHFLDRMLYWFGYPESVTYEDDSRGGPEASAVGRVRYGKGRWAFDGHIRVSKTHAMAGGFALRTDQGVLLYRDGGEGSIVFRPSAQPDIEQNIALRRPAGSAQRNMYDLQLEDFVRACATGTDAAVTAAQGTQNIRLIYEMYAQRTPMRDTFYGEVTA
jgi:predicted dehydrogenase